MHIVFGIFPSPNFCAKAFLFSNRERAFRDGAFREVLHPFNARAFLDPFFAVVSFCLIQAIFFNTFFTPPPAYQLFETEVLQLSQAWGSPNKNRRVERQVECQVERQVNHFLDQTRW